jgi:hypothetical protein
MRCRLFALAVGVLGGLLLATPGVAQQVDAGLNLPEDAVSNRVSLVTTIEPGKKRTYATLDGPGCIRHIWCTAGRNDLDNRNVVIRIFFDGEETPYVEAPLGDFFGVMHGKNWYPINTSFLSVQAKSGYNCYFPMPFAKSARVEFEAGSRPAGVYCQVDWHSYPGQELTEPRRFCARWRREFPTERYGEDYTLLDADGPGRLVGFVYGVRLIDNVDRWSHGGADNIYIDGDGPRPTYLRGIGGEDTFGTAYGGATHTPATHLNAEMAYYVHEDVGEARPAQNVTGYRWFANDTIEFRRSIHVRFGCMSNDICSTAYWYQEKPVRPFFRLPPFEHFAVGKTSLEIPRGKFDLPLPDSGQWLVSPADVDAIAAGSTKFDPTGWVRRATMRGFLDFGHVHRPEKRGAGVFHEGLASARATLDAPRDLVAQVCVGWDDRLVLRVNDNQPIGLGHRDNFGSRTIELPLKKGKNTLTVTLTNTRNFNHGGWAFAFDARTPEGESILPRSE